MTKTDIQKGGGKHNSRPLVTRFADWPPGTYTAVVHTETDGGVTLSYAWSWSGGYFRVDRRSWNWTMAGVRQVPWLRE